MKAIKQQDLELAKADLYTFNAVMSLPETETNKNLFCIAVYHLSQAIEKSFKGIIKVDRPDIFRREDIQKSHNIETLMFCASLSRKNLIQDHPIIAENALKLKNFNNMRYGLERIERSDIMVLYAAAQKLINELEQEYEQKYPDKQQNQLHASQEWENRTRVTIDLPPDEFEQDRLERKPKVTPRYKPRKPPKTDREGIER